MIVPEIAPEVTITSFARGGKGLCRPYVASAFWSPNWNRAYHPKLECCIIPQQWVRAVDKNPFLVSRTKFRLDSVNCNTGCVKLNLGFTNCMDFIGTNCLRLAEIMAWTQQGICDYGDKAAYFANPLSVGAIVHTIDDKYIFLRRRKHCCLDVGYIDTPCGYPCPQKASLNPNCCSTLNGSFGLTDVIFDCVLSTIEAETAIPLEYLGEPECLGIAQDRSRAWAPTLEFYVNTTLDSERIYFLYSRKIHQMACNSSVVVPATWTEMVNINSLFFKSVGACARGAILLYRELNYH